MISRCYTCSVLALLFSLPALSWAAEPVKVAYQVICDDRAVAEQVSVAIEENLRMFKLQVTDRLPKSKLFVYAQRDFNDRVNPEGWSFAIAHVSNTPTYYVAAKLISSNSDEVNAVKPALLSMAREDGYLTYMNVAHADRLTPENVAIIVHAVVQSFAERAAR